MSRGASTLVPFYVCTVHYVLNIKLAIASKRKGVHTSLSLSDTTNGHRTISGKWSVGSVGLEHANSPHVHRFPGSDHKCPRQCHRLYLLVHVLTRARGPTPRLQTQNIGPDRWLPASFVSTSPKRPCPVDACTCPSQHLPCRLWKAAPRAGLPSDESHPSIGAVSRSRSRSCRLPACISLYSVLPNLAAQLGRLRRPTVFQQYPALSGSFSGRLSANYCELLLPTLCSVGCSSL